MNRPNLIRATGLAMLLVCTAVVSAAPIYDPLDTAANFTGWTTGSTADTAVADGLGNVTLTREEANVDAGVDWFLTSHITIADHNRLEIYPVGTSTNGYYTLSLIFFDNTDNYITEKYFVTDSNSTSPVILPDIASFAAANSVVGADKYFLRFRIQPIDQQGASFDFTQINAVPEPASIALLVCAGVILTSGPRRNRNA